MASEEILKHINKVSISEGIITLYERVIDVGGGSIPVEPLLDTSLYGGEF
jgi:hypothetical protein